MWASAHEQRYMPTVFLHSTQNEHDWPAGQQYSVDLLSGLSHLHGQPLGDLGTSYWAAALGCGQALASGGAC